MAQGDKSEETAVAKRETDNTQMLTNKDCRTLRGISISAKSSELKKLFE